MPIRREQFREFMRGLVNDLQIDAIRALDPDMCCVCSRAKDFDPSNNDLWKDPLNQSAPRPDMLCFHCGEPLAVSHWMYGEYMAMARKPKICCSVCFIKHMQAKAK